MEKLLIMCEGPNEKEIIKILLENRVVSKIISISNNLRIHSDIGNLLQTFQILQPVKHAVSFRKQIQTDR